jgi:opacity protein-like surface antigen
MKKLLTLALALVPSCTLLSQQIDNRLDVSLGYGIGKFTGNETVVEGVFQSPSLFSNFAQASALTGKVTYRVKPILSLGALMSRVQGRGWNSSGHEDYKDARASLNTFSAIMKLHTRYSQIGRANIFRLFVEAGPSIGTVRVKLERPVFKVIDSEELDTPLSSSDASVGFTAGAGAHYTFHRKLGVYAGFSYQYYQTKSVLYNDASANCYLLGIGILYRLMTEKYFYY